MTKKGFSYYNVDTDRYQDMKIKRLKKNMGCTGIAVYDYILCEIYRVKGCFLVWDDNTAFDVADYFGLKETTVEEVVTSCCNVGLFDKDVRASVGVLTSRSILQRYLDMCKRSKRTDYLIPEFLKVTTEESEKSPEESRKTHEVLDREEKSRVKKSKEEEECAYDPVIEKSILDFFGVTELNYRTFANIRDFCKVLKTTNREDYFKTQLKNFALVKELNPFYKYKADNFIGRQSERFEDGKWCAENWEKCLEDEQKKIRSHTKEQPKTNRGVSAAMDWANVKMIDDE